jgi:MFS family permease
MSMALTRRPPRGKVGRIMLLAVAGFGVAIMVFGLSRSLPLSLLALTLAGAADMVSVVVRGTLVQTETPDNLRGRVNAINTLLIGTSNQLGDFKAGLVAAGLGPVGSVVLGGFGAICVVAIWGWRFRSLRQLEHE